MAVTPRTEPWSALLEAGRSDDRLVREAYEGARAAVFGEIPEDLHPTVVQALANAGIDALYTHQAQVSRLIRRALDRMRAAVVEDSDVAYPREEMATREVEEPQPQQQSTHSGRLLVRMPQSLHAELARVAEHEGVSLNTLITGALASSVGWRDGSVEGLPVVDAGAQDDPGAPQRPRWTSIALAANLVVVVLAAAVAIVLLVVALGHGW